MKTTINPLRLIPLASAVFVSCAGLLHAEIVAGWEMTGQTAWGVSPLPATSPSYGDPDATIGGLTRGAGFATTNSAVQNGWGGHGIDGPLTAADAIIAENFVTFTVSPSATFEFSATSLDLHYRRSGTGPTNIAIQYQVGAGAFTDVGLPLELGSSSTTGASLNDIDLSAIAELQDVSSNTVTFRLIPFGATDASGTFYIYGPPAGLDLVLNGSVQTIGSTGDGEPPLVASLYPADGSNTVTVDGAEILTIVFNEDIALGTGEIKIRNFTNGAEVDSINVADFDEVSLIENELSLILSTPLVAGSSYYVDIPSTAILDLALTPNAFPGFTGVPNNAAATAWNFTVAAAGAPPTVVINKYVNGPPDRVELLVVGNGIAGNLVDMRGMILKDFSSNTTGDGGGNFTFTTNALWAAVPVGTLIVASVGSTSPDVTVSDYVLSVGLSDATYFTAGGGTFDISTSEMVMIKAAGSLTSGTTGGIHGFAAVAASLTGTSFFTNFSGAKLRATADTGSARGAFANNPTSTLADFSGTSATGAVPGGQLNFGAPNNGTNASYIATLRGLLPGDGDGVVFTTNVTPGSPYIGQPVFDDGQTSQSVKVTINALIPGATITNAKITVPASLGTPTTATLSGVGGTGSVSVLGQVVTVNGSAATTANALEVTINGLSTPVPTTANYGNYALTVTTSASGGTLTPVATQPVVRVVVPISLVRNNDPVTGVSLDLGAVVAVDGTVSEAEFGGGASNFSGFLQDATGGINIFSPSINLGLVRPNRFVVIGAITQFNGLTEIVPSTVANVINLGLASEPVPQIITLATLLANPESYEGELVTVQNLSYVSGTWGLGATVVLKDSVPTNIDVRIQAGSTAVPAPMYPVNITGIVGQFDASSPFTSVYQLMPRDTADFAAGSLSDFDTWAGATGATGGMGGDTDFDGRNNGFEYAFGLNPTSGGATDPFIVPFNKATRLFSYTRRNTTLSGLAYTYQSSTTLSGPGSWTPFTPATITPNGGSPVETVVVEVPAALVNAAPKLFIRVISTP